MSAREIIPPAFGSLPPMYAWPAPLKKLVLVLATVACGVAYILLLGGIVGAVVLLAGSIFD